MSDWPRTLQVKFRYRDGGAVTDREVRIIGRGEVDARTDYDGRVRFVWQGGQIERVELEGDVVARHVSTEGMFGVKEYLDDITVKRPAQITASDHAGDDRDEGTGVTGVIFYMDGTRAAGPFTVELETFDNPGYKRSTRERRGYSKPSGEFYIPTPFNLKDDKLIARVYVNGREVPRNQVRMPKGSGQCMVILPAGMGKGGTNGGIVTGSVVDTDGRPVGEGTRISAQVEGGGLLSFMGSSVEARTDKKGGFALSFQGGVTIKKLTVDGRPAARLAIGRGPQETELPSNEPVRAGTYGLTVTRSHRKFLQSLWD